MLAALSPGEIRFIEEGVASNIRNDGRGRLDYRPFTLETGIISQTNGSARIVLDTTDVLVGIKAELGEPEPDTPNLGKLQVSVECCPSASPEFEGRGANALNVELATVIHRMLQNSNVIDLSKLCLLEGLKCWIIYVDALVLDSGGNLFDALSIATRAALFDTTIPEISIVKGESHGDFDLEIDPDKSFSLNTANIPICVTLTKIGAHVIVDATLEEEFCAGCRVTFSVNKFGNIYTTQKGPGTIPANAVTQMMSVVQPIAVASIQKMDDLLNREKTIKKKHGFLN